ncbi:uncharacterized protein LOC124160176 [Ischnura elegans]|uniref:uncharacterized protein LOC124160176 n=1 Tax=Ischnura elegans TaxID=197161 RepID=UPI001ED887F4|nr:uncharacterized protein LOC124160176 [Ischnura elegans]
MPPYIKVPSLYIICVNNFTKILHEYVYSESKENTSKLRTLVQTSLHSGIKQHLVEIATRNYRNTIFVLFDLLEVLLDRCSTRLHTIDEDNSLWLSECAGLFSRLEQCQAIGLEELSVRVQLNPRNDLEKVSGMNASFYRTLRQMTHLKVLVLRSVCDNEILRLLGRNCPHLEYLDVTSSWLVDDKGIQQLLLQDTDSSNYDSGGECTLLELDSFGRRNPCCTTLREVRIQDTNTSLSVVTLLLLLVSHLRSLGGFIYYRNIGDAIVKIASKFPSMELALAELWDTCLPLEKSDVIGRTAPNLTVLYTRADHLSNVSAPSFPYLTSLTVDFDFHNQSHLMEAYLQLRGGCLRKLALVDQTYPLSLSMLSKYCSSLNELSAKVCGGGRWGAKSSKGKKPLLPSLQTARLRLGSNHTLRAILGGCPELCHLDLTPEDADDVSRSGVRMFIVVGQGWEREHQDDDSDDDEYVDLEVPGGNDDLNDEDEFDDLGIDDSAIVRGLACNPNPKLTSLVVHKEWGCGSVALRALIHSCPRLRSVGDLYLWKGLTGGEEEVAVLALEALENNWDLSLVYRGITYPKRRGFPLWRPPSVSLDDAFDDEDEDECGKG